VAEQALSNIFGSCHLAFWDRDHKGPMMARVRQHGGIVEDSVSASTTHIVCKPNYPAADVAEKLKSCPPSRSALACQPAARGLCILDGRPGYSVAHVLRRPVHQKQQQPQPVNRPAC
jgi:hypothetical protein